MNECETRQGASASTIKVRAKNGTYSFRCNPGERVLYAGLRAGVPLPYECATGTCGTCKARTEASVIRDTWDEAPGRSYLNRERGEFLMCQCVGNGPCAIDVPAKLPEVAEGAIHPIYNRGEIVNVESLTHDVIFFKIALEKPMDFHAGQFVVVKVPGVDGFRAYSMVNYQGAANRLDFAVKRKPDGQFSERLFDGGLDGEAVEIFGPLGNAIFYPEQGKNILAIAGGSGIAGIMSILSRAAQEDYFAHHKGAVFFGVRTMADGFFLAELSDYVSAGGGNLNVTVAISDKEVREAKHPNFPALDVAHGFVHTVASQRMTGNYDNVIAFVAGPPPMVDGALRMLIIEARLPAADIRYDKFG